MASGNGIADHKGISRGKCTTCACLQYKEKVGSNQCMSCVCPSSKHEAQTGCVGAPNCTCKEYVAIPGITDCYNCGHIPKDHRGIGRITVASGQSQESNVQQKRFSDMLKANKEKRMATFMPTGNYKAGKGKGKQPARDQNAPSFRKSIKLQLKRPKFMNKGTKKTYVDDGDQQQVPFNKSTTLLNVLKAACKTFLNIEEDKFEEELSAKKIEVFLLDGKARVTDPSFTFNKHAFNFCFLRSSERSYCEVSSDTDSETSLDHPKRKSSSLPKTSPIKRPKKRDNTNNTEVDSSHSSKGSDNVSNQSEHIRLSQEQLLGMGKSICAPLLTSAKEHVYRALTFDVATQKWQPLGILSLTQESNVSFAEGGMKEAFHAKLGIPNSNPLLHGFKVGCGLIIKSYLPALVNQMKECGRSVKRVAMKEVQTQMVAAHLAQQFKLKVKGILHSTPEIIPCFLLEAANGKDEEPLIMEQELVGAFSKYSNNLGEATRKGLNTHDGSICLAFTHWTHVFTSGKMIVTDLQGVGLGLTDVQVSTKEEGYFGIGNLGPKTIQRFEDTHKCNEICKQIGLKNFKEGAEEIEKSNFVLK